MCWLRRKNKFALCVGISLLFIFGCDQNTPVPSSAIPPRLMEDDRTPHELPRIGITEFDRWLGQEFSSVRQLSRFELEPSESGDLPRNSLRQCDEDWSRFGDITLHRWPTNKTRSVVNIYTYQGKIELLFFQFTQYSYQRKGHRTFDSETFVSWSKKPAEYKAVAINDLVPLDKYIDKQCEGFRYNERISGYDCPKYNLSSLAKLRRSASRSRRAWLMDHVDEESFETTISGHFSRPSIVTYLVLNICDECDGSYLVVYKNTESMQRFIDLVKDDYARTASADSSSDARACVDEI